MISDENTAPNSPIPPPVAVGGLGGSGTRLVSRILQFHGYHMGSDMNQQLDNLWFSFLFRRRSVLSESGEGLRSIYGMFRKATQRGGSFTADEMVKLENLCSQDRLHFDKSWLRRRKQSMLDEVGKKKSDLEIRWGWKEPNTHVVVDSLFEIEPEMKYIHVYRHGIDMAFSTNQNQQSLWAEPLFGMKGDASPTRSLGYWCKMNERAFGIGAKYSDRFHALKYDDLCANPMRELLKLNLFIQLEPDERTLTRMVDLIQPNPGIGRYRQYDLNQFDPDDLNYVRELSFSIV